VKRNFGVVVVVSSTSGTLQIDSLVGGRRSGGFVCVCFVVFCPRPSLYGFVEVDFK
jgi:hypothetical protein